VGIMPAPLIIATVPSPAGIAATTEKFMGGKRQGGQAGTAGW
jgi:hypothetical protein